MLPVFATPTDPPETATKTETRIWEKTVDEHVKKMTHLAENNKTLFSLVWGQCTDIMRQRLEAHGTFAGVSSTGDGLGLINAVKSIAFQFQSQKYLSHALHESLKRYYKCAQGKFATAQAYLEHFQNVVEVVMMTSGGSIAGHPGVKQAIITEHEINRDDMTEAQVAEVQTQVTAPSTAMAFLLGCDRSRYGRLIEDLENDYLQGRNHYPATVAEAYNLLTNWKQERAGWRTPSADGVAFTNVDDRNKVPRNKSHITCHRCDKKGHYASECPEKAAATGAPEAGRNAQTGAMMLNAGIAAGEFNEASKVDVFSNGNLLTDIRESTESMDIHCNAGIANTNLIGELAGYGTVWYHPHGIAIILSLSRVKDRGYQPRDLRQQRWKQVYCQQSQPDGTTRVFQESERGLYYVDANDPSVRYIGEHRS